MYQIYLPVCYLSFTYSLDLFILNFMCMNVWLAGMYHAPHAWSVNGGQKRAVDPLEGELEITESYPVWMLGIALLSSARAQVL